MCKLQLKPADFQVLPLNGPTSPSFLLKDIEVVCPSGWPCLGFSQTMASNPEPFPVLKPSGFRVAGHSNRITNQGPRSTPPRFPGLSLTTTIPLMCLETLPSVDGLRDKHSSLAPEKEQDLRNSRSLESLCKPHGCCRLPPLESHRTWSQNCHFLESRISLFPAASLSLGSTLPLFDVISHLERPPPPWPFASLTKSAA